MIRYLNESLRCQRLILNHIDKQSLVSSAIARQSTTVDKLKKEKINKGQDILRISEILVHFSSVGEHHLEVICTTGPFIKLKCGIILLSTDYNKYVGFCTLQIFSVNGRVCGVDKFTKLLSWVELSYDYWTEPNAGPELKAKISSSAKT